jgi:hypothetical protein
MANSELSVNDQIAAAFREINTDWRVFDHVSSENTEALLKKKALRPDILILEHFSIRLGVSRVREISVAFFFGNTFEKTGDYSPKLLNGARLHFA